MCARHRRTVSDRIRRPVLTLSFNLISVRACLRLLARICNRYVKGARHRRARSHEKRSASSSAHPRDIRRFDARVAKFATSTADRILRPSSKSLASFITPPACNKREGRGGQVLRTVEVSDCNRAHLVLCTGYFSLSLFLRYNILIT